MAARQATFRRPRHPGTKTTTNRSRRVSCIVLFILLNICLDKAQITPITDGVLVTGRQPVSSKAIDYTVLVTMTEPRPPPDLQRAVLRLSKHIDKVLHEGLLDGRDTHGWTQRVLMLQVALSSPQRFGHGRTRSKRGLLNFIGDLSHTLFGTATDKSVSECKEMIKKSRVQAGKIVQMINELTSVVNRTFDDITTNRDRINEIGDFVSKTSYSIKQVEQTVNMNTRRWRQLQVFVNVESTLNLLEMSVTAFKEARAKYARQKASLEVGRLTEELLPPSHLVEALKQFSVNTITMITPVQWYYEYVTVHPMWDEEMLIYRAKLPLVDVKEYTAYKIYSWPLPYNTSGYSVQLKTASVVALDTRTGLMCEPKYCVGINPTVCRFEVTYKDNHFKCEKGILSGSDEGRKDCDVIIKKSDNHPLIQELNPGEYVIITWGESITRQCLNREPELHTLIPGVYLVKVNTNCTYSGREWTINTIKAFNGKLSLTDYQVMIKPIKLIDIIPEQDSIKLLNATKFIHLKPIVTQKLNHIVFDDDIVSIDENEYNVSIGKVILIVVVVLIGISSFVLFV